MSTPLLPHPWDLSPREAVALQQQLRSLIRLEPLTSPIRFIGGADLSYDKHSDEFYAGIVVLRYHDLTPACYAGLNSKAPFPYIPGLLSFREIPALLTAWEHLPLRPDVVICDGHGIAHPRRMGIAAHFGLLTGVPSIGCAKKILVGSYKEPAPGKGSYEPILHQQEHLGFALRTKDRVKPVFVSPGHLVSLEQSRQIVLHCSGKYRLPEPTRQAHLLVNRLRRGEVPPGSWSAE